MSRYATWVIMPGVDHPSGITWHLRRIWLTVPELADYSFPLTPIFTFFVGVGVIFHWSPKWHYVTF